MTFELLFQGKRFPVPKRSVLEFLFARRDLLDTKSYKVESLVSFEVFEKFVGSLQNQTKILVTKENVKSLLLLAKEFCFEELQSECLKVLPAPISSLSERLSKFGEQIESQETRLETLCDEIEKLKESQTRIASPETGLKTVCQEVDKQKKLDFPLKEAESQERIISYLTKKHGVSSNVHEKGIVTATSKSVYADASKVYNDPRFALNVAALTSNSSFLSNCEPGQWVC
jgi:hypothetical protein